MKQPWRLPGIRNPGSLGWPKRQYFCQSIALTAICILDIMAVKGGVYMYRRCTLEKAVQTQKQEEEDDLALLDEDI